MNLEGFKLKNWPKIFSFLFDFSILVLIFGTPLYLSLFFKTNNLFDLNKLFWFQVWLFLSLIFFLCKVLALAIKKEKIYFPGFLNKPKIYFSSIVLILFLALSILWSQNHYQSFFGSYSRNDGLVNWFCYFIFAFLVSVYLSSDGFENLQKKLRTILTVAVSSAFLVSIYAICQFFGFDFLIWQEPANLTHRASATLFQPNFLASFLLLTIPLTFLSAFLAKKNIFRLFFVSAGFLQLLALVFSGSRGAWLSFAATLLVFSGIFIFQNKIIKRKKIISLSGVILVLALIIFGLLKSERFQTITDFSEGSSAYRAQVYQAAISQIKKSPWLGYGAESQPERLVLEYQKDWAVFESAFLLPDRAHNLFLDLTLSFGLLGLAVWVFWYFSIFKILISAAKKLKNYPACFALGFSLLSYLFSLLFSFSVATTAIFFFLLFGISLALSESPIERKLKFNQKKYLAVFFALLISASSLVYSFKVVIADYYFYYFNQAWNIQEYSSAFSVREKIIKLGVADTNYRKMMLVKMTAIQNIYSDSVVTEKIKKIIQQDEKLFNSNSIFDTESLMELKVFNGNFQEADFLSNTILKSVPLWPKAYFISGLVQARMGKFSESRALFGRALSLLPDQQDRRLNEIHKQELLRIKGEIFFTIGQTHEIEKNFRNASNYYGLAFVNNEKNLEALRRIAFCFNELGEPERARAIIVMLENILKK